MSGLRLLLRSLGLTEAAIDDGLRRWCGAHAKRYLELLASRPTDHWQAAPRAAEILTELSRDHRLALLTGNPESMARARMDRLGLGLFFPEGQGAFGCDAEDRTELIGIARRRAGGWPMERTVLVGDTPKDIAGAHAAGITAFAVTTGRFGRDELGDAEHVLDALAELPVSLRALAEPR
jgi:phosphoglycolate phosphatase